MSNLILFLNKLPVDFTLLITHNYGNDISYNRKPQHATNTIVKYTVQNRKRKNQHKQAESEYRT